MGASASLPAPSTAATGSRFRTIRLVPFVAVLYAYCAGGPFGFEAMVSTAGPGMALLFILVVPFLFSIPMALATAEMASRMPVQGGFYRWTRAAFGPFWGFQCGWWNWTGTFLMCAAYGVMLADYWSQLAPLPGPVHHWAIAFFFLSLVAYLNFRGIEVVGKLTLVLLLVSSIPVAVFTVLGFLQGEHSPWRPLQPPEAPWDQVYGVGLALALWIYSGYEQLSSVTEEVEEPRRTFPRALTIVVPLAILSFWLPLAAGLSALGNWQEWETGYLVAAAEQVGGPALGRTMFVAAALCSFLLLQSTLLSATRVPYAMADDGDLPPRLAELHSRYRTPAWAIGISTGACALLAVLPVTQLIAIYAWMRAACSVLTLLALWRLRQTPCEGPRQFRVPGGTPGMLAVTLLPSLLFLWALANSDPVARLWGPIYLLLGPAAYWVARAWNHTAANQPRQ